MSWGLSKGKKTLNSDFNTCRLLPLLIYSTYMLEFAAQGEICEQKIKKYG